MSAPLLSFCIATFNRGSFIGETLDSLIAQLTDEVEIVVLDGGSSDSTETLMRRYETTCSSLRYLRQSENLGVDRDYDRAIQAARGRYCWLMTDDDILKAGALETVLQSLRDEPSLLVVNAEVRNVDLSRVLESSKLPISCNQEFTPSETDRLFAVTGQYLTFIGAVVIRREIWLERMREPYFGSLFIHVGVIFQGRLPGKVRVVAQPLIVIRYGNAMWRPREFEIWMFKWPALVWSFPDLSKAARAAVCPAEPWRDPRQLLFFRSKGTYSIEDYKRWIEPRTKNPLFKFVAKSLAVLPGPLAIAITLTHFRCFGPGQATAITDLRSSRFHFRNWRRAREMRR